MWDIWGDEVGDKDQQEGDGGAGWSVIYFSVYIQPACFLKALIQGNDLDNRVMVEQEASSGQVLDQGQSEG